MGCHLIYAFYTNCKSKHGCIGDLLERKHTCIDYVHVLPIKSVLVCLIPSSYVADN